MEKRLSTLRFGCAVQFRDRWQGRLTALEVDDQWRALNVVLSRGLWRPTTIKLPFSAVREWADDSIALDCSSDEGFGRQVPPVAAPARPLSGKSAVSAAELELRGALVERSQRRVSHLLLGRGLFASEEFAAPVEQVSLGGGGVRLAVQVGGLSRYRRDADLLQAVRRALAEHPYLSGDDQRGLTVEVVDGVVVMVGNVRTPQARGWAQEAAGSVAGAQAVRNEVAADLQLEIAVGQALDQAGLFRQAGVYVRSALGDVTLSGQAPSPGVREEIVRVVSRVVGVRSVIDRVEVREAAEPVV